MMSEFFHFQQFFLKYEGGGVQLTSPPRKSYPQKPSLIRVKKGNFSLEAGAIAPNVPPQLRH